MFFRIFRSFYSIKMKIVSFVYSSYLFSFPYIYPMWLNINLCNLYSNDEFASSILKEIESVIIMNSSYSFDNLNLWVVLDSGNHLYCFKYSFDLEYDECYQVLCEVHKSFDNVSDINVKVFKAHIIA